MSSLRTSREVVGAVEGMSERRVRRIAEPYAESVLAPLRRVVDRAEPTGDDAADARRLIERLGEEFEAMDPSVLADDVAAHLVQSALIGVATAPRVPRTVESDVPDVVGELVES